MTTSVISRALIKAYNLRQPPMGLVFHSNRDQQSLPRLLRGGHARLKGGMGACWDNSVVECFFGSLKHDKLFKTLAHMKQNVVAYMK